MAKRKIKQQAETDAIQQAQAIQAGEALQQIEAIQQQTKIMKQEGQNKSHDTEFSPEGKENLGKIGEEEVREAYQTLLKYREGKVEIEERIAANEEYWKMNHWEVNAAGKEQKKKRIEPKSAWLVNTLLNKHADAMDNFPEANILPRSRDDEETAKILSKIIPVILEQNEYEAVYSDVQWYKSKNGTGMQGVFWNNDKNNGLGDIDIKKIDILSLYWKPGISDIQDSPNVFHVTLMDNDEIKARYPEIQNLGSAGSNIGAEDLYNYGQKVDLTEQSAVIDWYYKRRVRTVDEMGIPQMRTILHYCKFCNEQVIYASENDPDYADRGWYDHGEYPFIPDTLLPVEASVCGMGWIDLIKDDQLYIDKLQQAILENALAGARPRAAVREEGGLNEEEYEDLSNDIIHFQGNLGEDDFRIIQSAQLSPMYANVYLQKIQEMKDTSGNTASSQGQASSVTSASGIASLQEAAGKLSRDASTASYRSYKKVVYQVIELIRQFYTEPRCFRIAGESGQIDFVEFSNELLQPQEQGESMGIDLGSRLPIMDIEVKPQKKSAYSKESQNQTALNLYGMGFFSPNNADASLACLQMMDFDGIEKMRERVQANGTLYEMVMQQQAQIMQLATIVDATQGTNLAAGASVDAVAMQNQNTPTGKASTQQSRGSLSSQAASATRNSTAPRG